MGRGGPEEPEIVHGEELEINAEFLLAQSEKGVHAASDHWEDALMSRILTIGCRRCGGGMAGEVFLTNMKKVSTECNVIGMTVKEAIEVISKYLDDCTVVHYKQCRIVHGCGTGKLRSGVHEYLKKCPYVESYRLGGMGEGGVGATVVTLK